MGFLENLGKGISDFSQSTIQKGKDVANVAKFSRLISDEERAMSKLFEQLGRKYFDLRSEDNEEDFADFIIGVKESQERIRGYQDSIKELQGITKCENCGGDIPNGARFCPDCGAEAIRREEQNEEGAEAVRSEKRYCPDCGAVIIPGSKFCTSCGRKVDEEEAKEEPEEAEL